MTRTRSQLFLCGFVAQAGFLTLSPILPDVAAEFGTSSAAVGQLRTLSGLVGGLVAVYLFVSARGPGLRAILRASLGAMLAGSLVSAAAPDMATLAAGQVAIGAASAGLLTAGIAAAARWPAESERASAVTWAIVGQPAAWVVGMPIIGVVADTSWRLTWVALPAAAAVIGLLSLRDRPADGREPRARATAREPLAGWAVGELFAHAAWGGTLVYAGALLRESYSISAGLTGVVLGLTVVAYFPGAFLVGHPAGWRTRLLVVTFALAGGLAIFGWLRPSLAFSALVLSLLMTAAAARTTLASSFVLEVPEEARLRASGARAAAMQFGYLLGALVAGTAIAIGGFEAMGLALAALLILASVPHVPSLTLSRRAAAVGEIYSGWRIGRFEPTLGLAWSPEFPDRPPIHEWLGEWRDWKVEPQGWVRRGERLVVLTCFSGTGRSSGARVHARGAHVWQFERGRAVSLEIFSDPALALAAAGSSLDTTMSRLARIPLSCLHRWHVTSSQPSAVASSSSTAAWARPSSSST